MKLPAAYESFLRGIGRGAGPVWVGTDVFFPRALELPGFRDEWIGEMGGIPSNALVWMMHQGYTAAYIRPEDGDDPIVFTINEYEKDGASTGRSFSAFVLGVIQSWW